MKKIHNNKVQVLSSLNHPEKEKNTRMILNQRVPLMSFAQIKTHFDTEIWEAELLEKIKVPNTGQFDRTSYPQEYLEIYLTQIYLHPSPLKVMICKYFSTALKEVAKA